MHTLGAIDSWIFILLMAMAALLRLLSSKAGGSKPSSTATDESTFPKPDPALTPEQPGFAGGTTNP